MDRGRKVKIAGIIPARKGSKGITNKNMLELNGKPLIQYTIEESLKSKLDEIYLTTDDKNIIDFCKGFYKEIKIPFIRPDHLSSDSSEAIDVAIHLLSHLKSNDNFPDFICWLQPTSPLRTFLDINNCIDLINNDKSIESVISVVKIENNHPYKMKLIDDNETLIPFINQNLKSTNRQNLPEVYIPNGAIFLINTNKLIEKMNFYGDKSIPYRMSIDNSVNIDSKMDFLLAELLLIKK